MKYSNLIICIISLILTSTSVYAAGYGGAIKNTEHDIVLYLECIDEDLSSYNECTEFQIVTSALNGSNQKRTAEFNLKHYSEEHITLSLEKQFKPSINRMTDNSWFESSGVIFNGTESAINRLDKVAPFTTNVLLVFLALPVVIMIPTIGLTYDLLKSPVVAIKDAVRKGNAYEMASEILEHLLDRNTAEAKEVEADFLSDFANTFRYNYYQ